MRLYAFTLSVILGLSGCASQSPVASPNVDVAWRRTDTAQRQESTATVGPATAGGAMRTTQVSSPVSISGDGGMLLAGLVILAVAAVTIAGIFGQQARRRGGAIRAVGKAVKGLGSGHQRDRLLGAIERGLKPAEREQVDTLLATRGLLVSRGDPHVRGVGAATDDG